MSDDFMKKPGEDYELQEEYDLSQLPIMPRGRYAPEKRTARNLVVLEPDLAQAFPSDEAVILPTVTNCGKILNRELTRMSANYSCRFALIRGRKSAVCARAQYNKALRLILQATQIPVKAGAS